MHLYINQLEFFSLLAALLMLCAYLAWFHRGWQAAALGLLLAAPLFLSVERMTQFLTYDETYIVGEPIEEILYSSLDNTQWDKAKFRTSDLLLAPISKVQHVFFQQATDTQMSMLFKAVRWLAGIALLLPIHWLAASAFVQRGQQAAFSWLFFPVTLLLPINVLSFKIINTDLLSMLLSVLALLCLYRAYVESGPAWALGAVVAGYLAAQEKLIASPILLFAIASYAVLRTQTSLGALGWGRRAVHLLAGTLIGLGTALLTGLAGVLLLGFLRQWDAFGRLLAGIPDPVVAWSWIIFLNTGQTQFGNFIVPRATMLLLLALSTAGTWAAAVVISVVYEPAAGRLRSAAWVLYWANLVLVPVLLLLSLWGAYTVTAYVAPAVPIEPGMYPSTVSFNLLTWHTGAATLAEQTLELTAFRYAATLLTVPSALWLGLLAVVVLEQREGTAPNLALEAVLAGGLLSPLAISLVEGPVREIARYMGISLYLVALVIAIRLANRLQGGWRWGGGLLIGGLMLAEMLPFGPLYGAFRPIWFNYGEQRSSIPQAGRYDPVWSGFGEEVMLAGQALALTTCAAQPCRINTAYLGAWLDHPAHIETGVIWLVDEHELRYTQHDYYIFNRDSLVSGGVALPDAEPSLVIRYRGYTQAWVYRGDHLAASGAALTDD